ncbi:MAG: polymer-forming cytoskeletal protein [Anaerolineae bacterium]|nr:polymer-forming cytoskeletal protein [Anaerolineae bacterium]
MKRWLRWLVALVAVLVVGMGGVGAAYALERQDDGRIEADEVIDDDVLISWETVVVDGTINGDLFASGNTVVINGVVSGNLLVNGDVVTLNGQVNGSVGMAGKTFVVNGPVTGSIYMAGVELVLDPAAAVGRNVIFTGMAVLTKEGSAISRDLLASCAQVQLEGTVGRHVEVDAAGLDIDGTIGGDVEARVESPDAEGMPFVLPGLGLAMIPSGLRVAEDAVIGGTLTYRSAVEQADAIRSAPAGGVVYEQVVDSAAPEVGVRVRNWVTGRLRDMITLFVLGGLAIWRAPVLLRRLADHARAALLPAAGWGIVVLGVGYVGAGVLGISIFLLGILLAIVTLGGLAAAAFGVGLSGLATAFALFTLLTAYGSKLVVAQVVGQALLERFAPAYADHRAWPLLLGLVIYVPLRSIPIFGWAIGALATLVGLGAMWLAFRAWHGTRQQPAPES